MRIVALITGKDLRQRFRDRSALMIMFVVPIGLAWLFSGVFGGLDDGGLGTVRMGVVAPEGDELATAFLDQVVPGVGEGLDLEVVEHEDAAAARAAASADEVDAVVVFPADFSARVQTGAEVGIEVVASAEAGLRGDVVAAVADGYADRLTGTQVAVASAARAGVDPALLEEIAHEAAEAASPVEVASGAADDRSLDIASYLAAGMAVFFLFFVVQFGVTSYLEESSMGTLPRLLAAPVHRWQVLGGKALTSLVVGLVSTLTLIVVSVPLMGAAWGDPIGVLVLAVVAVLSATALVGVVAALARTAEQAQVWQSILAIVLGMLGGTFFPVANGPGLLADLSLLTPHAWFLRGLGTLSGGGGVGDVLVPVGAMLAFTAVVGALGLLLTRRTSTA